MTSDQSCVEAVLVSEAESVTLSLLEHPRWALYMVF